MAIQLTKFCIDTTHLIGEANEWLKEHSHQIISITPITPGHQYAAISILIVYDDSDPVPQPLVARRIREVRS